MVRRVVIVALAIVAVGTPVLAQAPSTIGQATPTGSTLPTADCPPNLPWWLEGTDANPQLPQPTLIEGRPVQGPAWHPNPPPAAFAGSACNFNVACLPGDLFSPDYSSYQVLLGAYASSSLGPTINSFNYLPISLRCGWMLTAPDDLDGDLRGNWECLGGLNIAPIFSRYGHCAVGPSVYLRRNFVQPDAKIVPYAQLGAGFLITDAYTAEWQHTIGQAFELNFQASIGLRCFISDNWSLDIEGGYQCINNANMASRNAGVNALGAQVGFTYHFPVGGK
jgi:hypothetical protein